MAPERFTLNFTPDAKVAVDVSRTTAAVRAAGNGQHAVSLVLDNPYTVSIRDFGGRTLGYLDPEGVYYYSPVVRRVNYAGMIPVTMLSIALTPDTATARLHLRRDIRELVFEKDLPDPPQNWYADPNEYTYTDEFLVPPTPTTHAAPPSNYSMQPKAPGMQPQNPPPPQPPHFDPHRRSAALTEYQSARKEGPIMWLLWLLTGWIGGHRYYLGDKKFGVILTVLFFLGGLSIPVALVDGLLIHGRMREKNTIRWHQVSRRYDTPPYPLPDGTRD